MAAANMDTSKPPHGVYKNPRLMHACTTIVGSTVHLQTSDGTVWEGLFNTFSSEFTICLDLAVEIDPKLNSKDCLYAALKGGSKAQQQAFFDLNDIVRISVVDVDLKYATKDSNKITTDADISGFDPSKLTGLKQLEIWQDDDAEGNVDESLLSLDEADTSKGNGRAKISRWGSAEMFDFNEKHHNVKSTYDDTLRDYTIQLSQHNTKEWSKKDDRAAALAKEIESSTKSRNRLAKEDGSDCEEEKFSAVIRPVAQDPSPKHNSTPRHSPQLQQQQQQQHQQQQQQSQSQTQSHNPRPQVSTQQHQQLGHQQRPQPSPQQQHQQQTQPQSQPQQHQQQPQHNQQPQSQPNQQLQSMHNQQQPPASSQTQQQISQQQHHQQQSTQQHHTPQQQPHSQQQQQQQHRPMSNRLSAGNQNGTHKNFRGRYDRSSIDSLKNFQKNLVITPQVKDQPSQSEIAKKSTLNPNAKEFIYKPKSPASSQSAQMNGINQTLGGATAVIDPANSSPMPQTSHGPYYQQVPIFPHGLSPQQQHHAAQFIPSHMHFQSQIHYMPPPVATHFSPQQMPPPVATHFSPQQMPPQVAPHFSPQQMAPRYIRGNFQNYHHRGGEEHQHNVRAAYSQASMMPPQGQFFMPNSEFSSYIQY